jgi:hypothetical protein
MTNIDHQMSLRRVAGRDSYCLIFLHIPKTAGMSLGTVLRWNYRQDEKISLNTLNRPLLDELERLPIEKRSRLRFLSGHMPYGAHRHLPLHCEYITALRDPVDRVLSVYKHIIRSPRHPLYDRVSGRRLSLEEYVKSGIDRGQTENAQTRQLSGRQFDVLDDTALEEAKRNLERFLVVGLTERFEETMTLLRRVVGLRMPLYMTRNTSPPIEVPESAVELISGRNKLDLDLYAFAQDLFAKEIAMQTSSFAFEVSMFRAWRPLSHAIGGATDAGIRRLRRSAAAQRIARATRNFIRR